MVKIRLACRVLDKSTNVTDAKSKSVQFDTEEEGLSIKEQLEQSFLQIEKMVEDELKKLGVDYQVKQSSLNDHEDTS